MADPTMMMPSKKKGDVVTAASSQLLLSPVRVFDELFQLDEDGTFPHRGHTSMSDIEIEEFLGDGAILVDEWRLGRF
jgi:hypothetical protein